MPRTYTDIIDEDTIELNRISLESNHADVQSSETIFLQLLLQTDKKLVNELIEKRLEYLRVNNYAEKLQDMPFFNIAFHRTPAILCTLVLEMFVGIVISAFHDLLKRQIQLTSFLPVLSSIAGNIGLQSSAATTRAISTGLVSTSFDSICDIIKKEIFCSSTIASMAGFIMFIVSFVWQRSIVFSTCTGISVILGSIMAGFLGSLGPILFRLLQMDPTLMAGPFETAIQDVVGTFIYLGLASLLL